MGNKDNKKRYVLKRNKVQHLKNVARIMREAKQRRPLHSTEDDGDKENIPVNSTQVPSKDIEINSDGTNLHSILQNIELKKKENKFLEIECPPEQGNLLETPSQLHNVVSVPPNSEDTKMAMSATERQLRCREKLKSQEPEKHEEKKRKHTEYMKNKRTFIGQSPATEQNKRRKQWREANERKRNKTKMKENQDSSSGNEIKIFCPKCNTEVLHTAEGIQEDQTKILIAKVYHYFEHEYEELKKMYGDLDLSPLSRFHQRTALATGVSETTVLQILKEEEGRNADKRQEPAKKRRIARKRSRQPGSSSEEDSSDDNVDDGGQSSFIQLAQKEPEIETLVVKLEPLEYYKEQPQTDPISIEVKAEPPDDDVNNIQQSSQWSQNIIIETGHNQDQLNRRHTINVIVNNKKKERQQRYREQNREKLKQREAERRKRKQYLQSIAGPSTSSNINRIEMYNEEIIAAISQSSSGLEETQTSSIQRNEQDKDKTAHQKFFFMYSANETLALNESAGTKPKVIKIPRSDVTSTQQHTQCESSTTAAASSVQLTEQLHESGLLGGTEVKLEKIEIGEEGFS